MVDLTEHGDVEPHPGPTKRKTNSQSRLSNKGGTEPPIQQTQVDGTTGMTRNIRTLFLSPDMDVLMSWTHQGGWQVPGGLNTTGEDALETARLCTHRRTGALIPAKRFTCVHQDNPVQPGQQHTHTPTTIFLVWGKDIKAKIPTPETRECPNVGQEHLNPCMRWYKMWEVDYLRNQGNTGEGMLRTIAWTISSGG